MTLEELLNKLIEKGWKPFNMEATRIEYNGGPEFLLRYKGRNKNGGGWNVRNLVSKESNLWQFVCENGMVNELYDSDDRAKNYDGYFNECDDCCSGDDYEYRIIESALKDESELEQFLLDNIKIEG